MALTFSNWVFVIIVFLAGIGASLYFYFNAVEMHKSIVSLVVTIVLSIALIFGTSWYNKNTASGARNYKDFQSNLHNGIERSLQVVADDGMIIYERHGHFDIEIHDDYIVFDENHERTILYRSYTSTLIIEEVGE